MDPFASEGEDDRGLLRLEVREHAFYIHIYIYVYVCVVFVFFLLVGLCCLLYCSIELGRKHEHYVSWCRVGAPTFTGTPRVEEE